MPTIQESTVTVTDTERREIAELRDKAQNHLIHGKFVPPPVQASHLESKVPQPIHALLTEFADGFHDTISLWLPPSLEVDHTVDLELGARPPAHRVYRMSSAEETELKSQLDAYLQARQIDPAKSPFGAGVLFARQKDCTLRSCIDHRALNNITKKDKYPLPRIDELIGNMASAAYFTKIDLQKACAVPFRRTLEVFNFA